MVPEHSTKKEKVLTKFKRDKDAIGGCLRASKSSSDQHRRLKMPVPPPNWAKSLSKSSEKSTRALVLGAITWCSGQSSPCPGLGPRSKQSAIPTVSRELFHWPVPSDPHASKSVVARTANFLQGSMLELIFPAQKKTLLLHPLHLHISIQVHHPIHPWFALIAIPPSCLEKGVISFN